jgi:PHP family Zn ribbon phosphoesterase
VILKFEEYESIRLVNYELLPQDVAAKQMNVSRPTFTRIYNRALKTIARSFVEGKALEIEGGNYKLDNDWYRCKKCYKLIQGIENHVKCKDCTAYGESELVKLN